MMTENKWTELFKSRKFWTVLAGIIGIIIASIFGDNAEAGDLVEQLTIIFSGYIVGTSLDPKYTVKFDWKGLLGSRKFVATVVSLIILFAKTADPNLPIDEASLTNIIYLLTAYVVGTGINSVATKMY